jgi:hypothetical protein
MRLKTDIRGFRRRRAASGDRAVSAAPRESSTRERAFGVGARDRLTRLVVDVGDRSEAWRNAAIDAERAFARWRAAPPGERSREARRYLAAIDLEERAAIDFRCAWEACCSAVP